MPRRGRRVNKSSAYYKAKYHQGRASRSFVNRPFRSHKHKPINNRIHKFTFNVYKPMEQFTAGLGTVQAYQFDLKQALGSELAQFQATFDTYRIRGVKVRFVPKWSGQLLQNTTSGLLIPELWTCIDLDDANPINETIMVEHWGLRRGRFTREYSRFIKPRFANMIYNTPTSTAYGLGNRNMFLDCDDDSIPHYGLKWLITPATTLPTDDTQLYFDVYLKYYIEFKGKI